jgi:hypothetical protein
MLPHKGIMLHIGMSGQNTLLYVKEGCSPGVLFRVNFIENQCEVRLYKILNHDTSNQNWEYLN